MHRKPKGQENESYAQWMGERFGWMTLHATDPTRGLSWRPVETVLKEMARSLNAKTWTIWDGKANSPRVRKR